MSTSTLPPPVIPLAKLREEPVKMVPAPVLPGFAVTAVSTAPAPPAAPKAPSGERTKKPRRMELAGLESGDPRSTYHLIMLGTKNTLATGPKLVKQYWWQVLVLLLVWYGLGTFNSYKLGMSYPALRPLWNLIDKFLGILVFITASYNNFVAKGVYAAVIMRVGLPMAKRIRKEGLGAVVNEFRSLVPGLKSNWAQAGPVSMNLLVGFWGVGAFLSNYLTRNNKIDKIAVSLVLAIALMKALGDGPQSFPFMAGRIAMKDLFVMMLKPSPVRNHHIYVAVSGLAIGFLCALPFAFLAPVTTDQIGYVTGLLAIVVAVVLYFVKNNAPKGTK